MNFVDTIVENYSDNLSNCLELDLFQTSYEESWHYNYVSEAFIRKKKKEKGIEGFPVILCV